MKITKDWPEFHYVLLKCFEVSFDLTSGVPLQNPQWLRLNDSTTFFKRFFWVGSFRAVTHWYSPRPPHCKSGNPLRDGKLSRLPTLLWGFFQLASWAVLWRALSMDDWSWASLRERSVKGVWVSELLYWSVCYPDVIPKTFLAFVIHPVTVLRKLTQYCTD